MKANSRSFDPGSPTELFDEPQIEKNHKELLPRSLHHISGLGNITYRNYVAGEPASPVHFHKDILEIFCLVKGHRTCSVLQNGEMTAYHYNGGEIFLIHPDEVHASGLETQEPCEMYALQINLAERDRFLTLNREAAADLCDRLARLPERHLRISRVMIPLISNAFQLISAGIGGNTDAGVQYLTCFLYELLRLQPVDAGHPHTVEPRIEAVVEYIRAHPGDPLPLNELAAVSGYSLSRFKALFRSQTGVTPAMYITDFKISTAKQLLTSTEDSVADIAYTLGWSSPNYFCSVFKKLTGLSPLQYRRQQAAESGGWGQ